MSVPTSRPTIARLLAGWREVPLFARVLIGVGLGVLLGVVFGQRDIAWGISNADLGSLGMLVIDLLKALAAPLILMAILDAFVRTDISGRAGAKMIAISLMNVSVAFALGLLILNTFKPGELWREDFAAMTAPSESSTANAPREPPKDATLEPLANLRGYIPKSLIEPLLANNVISLVLIGLLAGAAIRSIQRNPLLEGDTSIGVLAALVSAGYQVLMRMLMWVVEWVPLAVLGATAQVVGERGIAVFSQLWVFLATMLLGLGIHSLVYYPTVVWLLGGKSPREYLVHGIDAVLTGLSTNSSLATMPLTLRTLTGRLGVSEASARLSACVGTNLNNDGITLYEAMAALFLAQAAGFDLSLGEQMAVVAASLMAGIGVAGIPEAGLIVLPLVLAVAGFTDDQARAALVLIVPVDWIIARCRSGVNVLSDLCVAILLDRPWFRRGSLPASKPTA